MKKVIRDFNCVMCGRCCANQDLIQLTAYELCRLAAYLNMEPTAFFDKYCNLTATNLNPSPHIYIKTSGGACPFLKDNKCDVHDARPYACKAYPMRVYWSLAGDVKEFVKSRYPTLEETCMLFKLDDGDVLLGDYDLLAKQSVAYWVDDAYFSMEKSDVDLSIPYRVADFYIYDKETGDIAKRYVVNPEHPPTAFDAEAVYAKISLMVQAAMWGLTSGLIRVKGRAVGEDERVGKYMLLTTDAESVRALRMLVEGGRLDLAKTLAIGSKSYPGKYIIAAAHGSSRDEVALGFAFDADKATLDELTDGGKKPLHVFFRDENAVEGKLVGFQLSVKI